jgi:hypothetical protein
MSIINNNLLLAAEDGGYVIDRSLRFRRSASPYLNRTPASAGNRKTWTWSAWVKRGIIDPTNNSYYLFSCYTGDNDNAYTTLYFFNDRLRLTGFNNSALYRITTQLFRDPSAWYHVVVAVDTTQATANNRIRIYVNGVEITSFSTLNNPSQNADLGINQSAAHFIGADTYFGPIGYLDGYLTEVNFIDGQALTPSSFGETDAVTGVWKPKAYEGTYGTNGFYLDFKDPTSTTTLTADQSGNGNNWTANNISLTSGATYDSMIDTPTPVADVRGNFAVLNPLKSFSAGLPTFSQANLQISESAATNRQVLGTIGFNAGKFYWETTVVAAATIFDFLIGIINDTQFSGNSANYGGRYRGDGTITNIAGTSQTSGSTYTANDIIGIAVDADNGTVQFYKNGVAQGSTPSFTFAAGTQVYPSFGIDNNLGAKTLAVNFGQRPFAYTPPSGFKALHTGNLPEPAIVDGGKYFNTVLYTGNGSNRSITGVGFQPDFVWIKSRSATYNNNVFDAVRGVEKYLLTDSTLAENGGSSGVGSLTSFNSDGFSLGTQAYINNNGTTFVGWNWKANGAGVTNTAGSITSTVSANPTAGFSIVTYTGNGTNGATVGHSLGVVPQFVIIKSRSASRPWLVWHGTFSNGDYIILNSTAAKANDSRTNRPWGTFTSSILTLGEDDEVNTNGGTYVAYCFAEVPGYSRFGSYTGNGSADGPFVFCGFRPRWILYKRATNTTSSHHWILHDTARDPYNEAITQLFPNLSNAEGTTSANKIDILSNGFKLRGSDGASNASGETYIFAAFSESPFKHALAR